MKPCRIDDTVCVQPRREVIGSIFFCPRGCSRVPPEGLSELLPEFRGSSRRAVRVTVRVSKVLPKGCPRHHPRDCPTASQRAVRGTVRGVDEGVYPRGWEVVNPSCGDLHRRSSSTLLPLRYKSVTIRSNPVCISIVFLGVLVVPIFFVFCRATLQRHHEPCYA